MCSFAKLLWTFVFVLSSPTSWASIPWASEDLKSGVDNSRCRVDEDHEWWGALSTEKKHWIFFLKWCFDKFWVMLAVFLHFYRICLYLHNNNINSKNTKASADVRYGLIVVLYWKDVLTVHQSHKRGHVTKVEWTCIPQCSLLRRPWFILQGGPKSKQYLFHFMVLMTLNIWKKQLFYWYCDMLMNNSM